MSVLKLTYIEDVVESLAKRILGSDELQEALSIIGELRETLGHEAPEPAPALDPTYSGIKDQVISDLQAQVAASAGLVAEMAARLGLEPAVAPVAPVAPVPAEPAAVEPVAAAPVVPVNPFEAPAPVAAAGPAPAAPAA